MFPVTDEEGPLLLLVVGGELPPVPVFCPSLAPPRLRCRPRVSELVLGVESAELCACPPKDSPHELPLRAEELGCTLDPNCTDSMKSPNSSTCRGSPPLERGPKGRGVSTPTMPLLLRALLAVFVWALLVLLLVVVL